MSDNLTPKQRKKAMQHNRSKDTSIEIRLRTALWNKGIHYRKNVKSLPGKPDIAITKWKIAVFCDGSFWHGRDWEHKKPVMENRQYWGKKIQGNIKRDADATRLLRGLGWVVLRFWDVDINKNLDSCVDAVQQAVMRAKGSKSS